MQAGCKETLMADRSPGVSTKEDMVGAGGSPLREPLELRPISIEQCGRLIRLLKSVRCFAEAVSYSAWIYRRFSHVLKAPGLRVKGVSSFLKTGGCRGRAKL